jgi:hypothetical protein
MSTPKLSKLMKQLKNAKAQTAVKQIARDRAARGVCRHCGGPVPCWSAFGDEAVGKRRGWPT